MIPPLTIHKPARLMAMLLIAACSADLHAQGATEPDLSSLSLEQLTHIEVNTASRKEQELFKTPAAVYVITQEDIERSGVTTVPELLRMVPGIEVAQVDANKWAVSARGFNSRFSNKMLLMIDERTIYNPAYSGTLWDQNDLLLDNIERIEIVRGPGATMWGANAVNGVINIVTKKAKDTQSGLITGSAGRIDDVAGARYGWSVRNSLNARVDAKYVHRNNMETETGGSAQDSGTEERVEARLDWKASDRDQLSFQGDLFRNPEHQMDSLATLYPDFAYGAGGFAMAKWERRQDNSDLALQGYYNDEDRREAFGMKVNMQTLDFDLQHHIVTGPNNDVMWGVGYRWTSDYSYREGYFAHHEHHMNLGSAFLQDSYAIVPDKFTVTAGTKLLWNSYTHYEIQPRASVLWTPDTKQSAWGAVSRAVRIPADKDRDLLTEFATGTMSGLPYVCMIYGNQNINSEIVMAYEGGYRRRFGKAVSADLAGFVNHYTQLNAMSEGAPTVEMSASPYVLIPVTIVNGYSANSQGLEAALIVSPLKELRFRGSYTWAQGRLTRTYPEPVDTAIGQDWSAPRNTYDARAYWTLTRHWEATAIVNGNSRITTSSQMRPGTVPGHLRADLRIARKLGKEFELAAGATNLASPRHREFYLDDYVVDSYVPRGAYFSLHWVR